MQRHATHHNNTGLQLAMLGIHVQSIGSRPMWTL